MSGRLLNFISRRYYRFGRRVLPAGYYVPTTLYDQPQNIQGLNGQIKYQNELFNEELERQKSLVTRCEKIEIELEDPFKAFNGSDDDDQSNNYTLMMNANISTPYDCAKHVNELVRNRSVLALINDQEYYDMNQPLRQSCHMKLLHFKHPNCMPCNYAFWRSCSMILASVIPHAFKDEFSVQIVSKPMSDLNGGSFICDILIDNLDFEWKTTSQELQSITSMLWDEITRSLQFERLQISANLAQKLFANNRFRLAEIERETSTDRQSFTVYRCGQHIELCDGPMIANTSQIGSIYLSAIHSLKQYRRNMNIYRFQGIAMPKQLNINPFAYQLIRNRSKLLNPFDLE